MLPPPKTNPRNLRTLTPILEVRTPIAKAIRGKIDGSSPLPVAAVIWCVTFSGIGGENIGVTLTTSTWGPWGTVFIDQSKAIASLMVVVVGWIFGAQKALGGRSSAILSGFLGSGSVYHSNTYIQIRSLTLYVPVLHLWCTYCTYDDWIPQRNTPLDGISYSAPWFLIALVRGLFQAMIVWYYDTSRWETCTFGPLNVPSRHDAHIGASIATSLGLRCTAGCRTTGLFEGHHACFTSWHAQNREGCKYHNLDGFPRMLAAGISTSGLKLPHLFMLIWIRHMDCAHGFWRLSKSEWVIPICLSFGFGLKTYDPPKTNIIPWKLMVGRWFSSFLNGPFSSDIPSFSGSSV